MMRLSRSAAGNRWTGLRRAAGGAALPAAAWRRCGAQPVLWAPRAAPRGLRRQLFSTSVAEDMQVGAAGGVSPAAAEDSPAAEAAQEQVVSVDDEDEQLAAGGDDDEGHVVACERQMVLTMVAEARAAARMSL